MGIVKIIILIVIGYLVILLTLLVLNKKDRDNLWIVSSFAYIYKLILMIIVYLLLVYSPSKGFAFIDDQKYHEAGIKLKKEWTEKGFSVNPNEVTPGFYIKNDGYYYLSGFLYFLFGEHPIVPRIFNIIFSVLSLIILYKLGTEIWGEHIGKKAAWWMAVLPDLSIWTSLQFKDAIVIFLVLWTIYHNTKFIYRKPTFFHIFSAIAGIVALFEIRLESALFLTLILIFLFFTDGLVKTTSKKSFFIFTSVLALISLLIIPPLLSESEIVGFAPLVKAIVEKNMLSDFTSLIPSFELSTIQNSGILKHAYIFRFGDLWRLPIGLVFSVIAPFPWWPIDRPLADNIISFVTIPWLLILPAILAGTVKYTFHQKPDAIKPMLYHVIGMWLALAFFIYVFSPSRHRLEFVPLLLLIGVAFLHEQPRIKQYFWGFMGVIFFSSLTILYLFTKI